MSQVASHLSLSKQPPVSDTEVSGSPFDPFSVGTTDYETLPGLLRVLQRRWLTVVLVGGAIIVLGTIICFIITPKYSSTTMIEVNPGIHAENGNNSSDLTTPTADELKAEIETDINILQSDDLALAVIQRLGLQDDPSFHGPIDAAEKGRPLGESPRKREYVTKLFERSLKVESPPDTRLIKITYQSPNPRIAATVADTVASEFIEGTSERHYRSTAQTSYWLQKELDELKKQVENSEQKMVDYGRRTGLAGIQFSGSSSGDGTSSVSISPHNTVTERLFALNQELTAAEANRISTEIVNKLVQSQSPDDVLGLGAMSVSSSNGSGAGALTSDSGIELVRTLRAQELSLMREYTASSVKYGTNNPRLIQLQQQISAVGLQMQAELQRVSKRAANAYVYAKRNEDNIRDEFTKQQAASNVLAGNTVRLQVVAQEAYSNRALYESLFSKLQTARLTASVRATHIDVVSHARLAGTPTSPDYAKYIALISGFGMFLGVSSAFLRESLDETVRTPRQLNDGPKLEMLGYVASISAAKRVDVRPSSSPLIYEPTSSFSESFRAVRTAILMQMSQQHERSILVTSAVGGEGKTTIAYNLGVAFAQQGARVLLMDGDLRNPGLHHRFGCALTPGLSDLVAQFDKALPGIVQHPKLKSLYILPAGAQPELPAELFGSQAFDLLLKRYRSDYDYVLIDSPPILAVTDASIIAAKVGGIVAVVRSGCTTRALFSGLIQSLQRTHTPLLGFVLNDVRRAALKELQSYSYVTPNKGDAIHANF